MPLEISNIVLTNAVAFYGPYGSTPPEDTVALGAAWPAGWSKVGFTGAPLTFGYEYAIVEVDAQEALGPINAFKTNEKLALETSLLEIDLALTPLAWEGSTSTVSQAAGVAGAQVYNVGGKNKLTKRAWGFEGGWVNAAGDELPLRVFVWRAAPAGGSGLEFSKEKPVGFPLKLMALEDLTKTMGERFFQMRRITAPAL